MKRNYIHVFEEKTQSNGGIMNQLDENVIEKFNHGLAACQGVDFLTLSEEDAKNVVETFWSICQQLSGDESDKGSIVSRIATKE